MATRTFCPYRVFIRSACTIGYARSGSKDPSETERHYVAISILRWSSMSENSRCANEFKLKDYITNMKDYNDNVQLTLTIEVVEECIRKDQIELEPTATSALLAKPTGSAPIYTVKVENEQSLCEGEAK